MDNFVILSTAPSLTGEILTEEVSGGSAIS
jgi:hypothetical protein